MRTQLQPVPRRRRTPHARRRIILLSLWLAGAALAESPQDAVRRAMEASVSQQRAAVARMRLSIETQRATVRQGAGQTPVEPVAEAVAPFFTLSWPAMGTDCGTLSHAEIGPLVTRAAAKEGLEEGLLRAVVEQESGRRACAVSARGAMGLMQLMPATAAELGVRDPFDPEQSLLSGAHLLKQLLTRFGGDTALALAAYNAGPARVEESGGVPRIPETMQYVQQILSRLPFP